MRRTFFTREEARNKIGCVVEAMADFPSVPKGSRGRVVRVIKGSPASSGICRETSDITNSC